LARLVVEFFPTDGSEDGGKLLVQTDPLKQVHIKDMSVSKLLMVKGLILLHLLRGEMEMSSLFIASGMSSCARQWLDPVVLCGDGTKDEHHGESCDVLSLE
jgi:hypothetical protein